MRISKFGITLRTLKEEDIELLREKRNSDLIRKTMHYQEIITPEMQKLWFEKIKNSIYNGEPTSFYFIIIHKNEKIGLINGKNIDHQSKSCEGGFFIWAQEYWGTLVPVMTSMITLDYSFLINDYRENYIQVLRTNSNAIFYNKQLGYEPTDRFSDDKESQYYVLTRDKYLKQVEKFRDSIGKITNDYEPLSIANLDFKDFSDEEIKGVYPHLPDFQKQLVKKILEGNKRIISLD